MTTKAKTILRKLIDRKEHVVTFTKADGTLRAMRLRYQGGTIRGAMMQVFDLDKQAIRTINLETVHTHGAVTMKPEVAREVNNRRLAEISAMFSY